MKDRTNRDAIIIQVMAIVIVLFIYVGILYLVEQYVGFWIGTIFAFIIFVMFIYSILVDLKRRHIN